MDLTEFLLARIDEDEAVARAVITANHGERQWYANRGGGGPDDAETDFDFQGPVDGPSGWSAIYVGPARVLAECEAKRRIVAVHHTLDNDPEPFCWNCDEEAWPCKTMAALASVYADHLDYDQEWRPVTLGQAAAQK